MKSQNEIYSIRIITFLLIFITIGCERDYTESSELTESSEQIQPVIADAEGEELGVLCELCSIRREVVQLLRPGDPDGAVRSDVTHYFGNEARNSSSTRLNSCGLATKRACGVSSMTFTGTFGQPSRTSLAAATAHSSDE